MAYTEKRPNGRYRGCYRGHDGKIQRVAGTFADKTDALAAAIEAERKLRTGGRHAVQDRTLTWGDWREPWLASRRVAASTDVVTRTVIGKWLTPYWGERKLTAITPHDIRQFLVWMRKQGASPHVEAKALSQLSASLTAAGEASLIDANPAYGIKPTKAPKGPGLAFTETEVATLLSLLAEPYRTAALLMVYMGLRFGEMAGMHWGDVYESRRQVYISHTWSRDGRVVEPYPKDEDCRWVPIPLIVAEALQRPADWREPCGLQHQRGDRCAGQLVLPGRMGVALDSKNMGNRHWKPALRAAGLERGRQHDLRHTYITWLIEAGMTADEVAPLVGHSSTYVTERYTHLLSKHHGRALDILDRLGVGGPAAA